MRNKNFPVRKEFFPGRKKSWILGCVFFTFYLLPFTFPCYAESIKQPNASGKFYPANPQELQETIDRFLNEADPEEINDDIAVLISPHAGYEFSGRTAAYGYNAIKGKQYDSIIILGPSHYSNFKGAALWPKGAFITPLGEIPVDELTCYDLMLFSSLFSSFPEAFNREHSIEAQLPFLQRVLGKFKIVPIVLGHIDFSGCQNLAKAISRAIKDKSCLVIASSDMYHGFNYQEGELKDIYTLSLIRQLRARELYENIQDQRAELCGWAGVVISMLVAEELGYEHAEVLDYTNSSKVMGKQIVGEYSVGYSSVVICNPRPSYDEENIRIKEGRGKTSRKKGGAMLNQGQRKRLLEIARKSIESYLKNNKKLELSESDPVLSEHCGAFVTLHKDGKLQGCIGNIIGRQPLYLTIRDMAVEAAVHDSRFNPLTKDELDEVEIEISALSPMERINNPDKVVMGQHGVLVRRGFQSGVFLPQVATETGWSKEEFLS
ncbi:MAG: AmmeMemoRadiSam system protein B, partial [Candidatus Omnitrophota bacterium]